MEDPSSPETRFLPPLTALLVSRQSYPTFCEIINLFVEHSLDNITALFTRKEHSLANITVLLPRTRKLSVCDKREHPEYITTARRDKDIVILKLCQPLMFSKGLPIPN